MPIDIIVYGFNKQYIYYLQGYYLFCTIIISMALSIINKYFLKHLTLQFHR